MLKALKRAYAAWRSPNLADRLWLEQRLRDHAVTGWVVRRWARLFRRSARDYVTMQQRDYERRAAADVVKPGEIEQDFVVGVWREHDEWPDYEQFLMRYVEKGSPWVALDFGCGPGRNIRRWTDWFARIDGVDISARNLENARVYLRDLPNDKQPRLYVTSGMDCGDASAESYDFVFSTICLQHICVYSVRFAILQSMYRCLKPGGRLSLQMGFGAPKGEVSAYKAENVSAIGTNSLADVAITSPDQPRRDLEKIGFINFEHWIRPRGPGDQHEQWIFFTALKPGLTK